jgi:hypothetical protein
MLLYVHPFMNRPRTVPSVEKSTFLQEEALFIRTVELSVAARARFLAAACSHHPALMERVQTLLRAHDRAEGFLDSPAFVRRRRGEKNRTRAS